MRKWSWKRRVRGVALGFTTHPKERRMTHQHQANGREIGRQLESWNGPDVPSGNPADWAEEGRRALGESDAPQGWFDVLELLSDYGFEGMARAMQLLINEAMKLERSAALGADPYERTPNRRGQANGFKPKTVQTRVGPLALRVP